MSDLLLCDESKDMCFDDLDEDDEDHQSPTSVSVSLSRSEPLVVVATCCTFPAAQTDDAFAFLVKRESEFLPKDDYLSRLRSGQLDLPARLDAFDWICKAHTYYGFGPLSLCLAVNYLDRFYSIRELPRDKAWAVQLLAVACLSIAAKVEETIVPQTVELQVGDPKYVFEAKTIQRMELLVLDTLRWKMNAVTPCSFLDYTLRKVCDDHYNTTSNNNSLSYTKVVNRSMQVILCTIRGIDFLEFRPSEIAAAVAISISAEIQAVDIDKSITFFTHLEKGRIMKCMEMIKEMLLISTNASSGNGLITGQRVPESPIGVLDAACFSSKSDDVTTFGSSANSSSQMTTTIVTTTSSNSNSPETKRKRRLDTTTSGLDSLKDYMT